MEQMALKHKKRCLTIVHYVGNANLNYSNLPFLTYQTGKIQKLTAYHIEGCRKTFLFITGGKQSDATTDKGHLTVYNTITYAFIL